jgi:KamA family protein
MTQLQRFTTPSRSNTTCTDWQSLLRDNVTDPEELCKILRLPLTDVSAEAAAQLPLNVTRDYLSRIEPGNPDDPLLLQILPQQEELNEVPEFSNDPLDEAGTIKPIPLSTLSGCTKNTLVGTNHGFHLSMLQKYPGRTLILASDRCASQCRFCFRRHFPKKKPRSHSNHRLDFNHVQYSTEPLTGNDEISEVREIILSGGDPLMLNDVDLDGVLNYIKNLYPGNRVRLHTRLPILLPERVTPQLVELLRDFRFDSAGGPVYVVLHINHPNELSDKVVSAITALIDAGIPVLSQTVLLKHVNDRFETLFDLFEKLANIRVLPYYLHQLDRVQGAAHFEVPTAKGLVLLTKLSATLPGYAVPRYVRELPGESKKTRL